MVVDAHTEQFQLTHAIARKIDAAPTVGALFLMSHATAARRNKTAENCVAVIFQVKYWLWIF